MSRWPWRGGRKRAVGLIKRAIGEVCPEHDASAACGLWAAGAKALASRGRIMAGAFVDVTPEGHLRGWGINSTQLALGRSSVPDVLMLQVDKEVGPEGGYAGHVGLEIGDRVVDVMHNFSGSLIVDGWERVCLWGRRAYIAVPNLAALVRRRWRVQMQAIEAIAAAARP